MVESLPGSTTALREELAAANARADAALAEIVNEQRRFGEVQAEAWKLDEALAAARRECDEVRGTAKLLLEIIDRAESKEPHSPWCNGVHEGGMCEGDVLTGHAISDARAALAAPAAASGEEGT